MEIEQGLGRDWIGTGKLDRDWIGTRNGQGAGYRAQGAGNEHGPEHKKKLHFQ